MKKISISLFSLLLFLMVSNSISANPVQDLEEQDSMIIQFGKSRVVIYLADKKDKEKLQDLYDKGVLRNAFRYLDSNQLADTAIVKDNSGEYRIIKRNGETVIYYDKVKDIDKNVRINTNWNKDYRDRDRDDDDDNKEVRKRRYRTYVSQDFGIDIGMNAFIPKEGALAGTLYELNPLRSNYIALSFINRINISRYTRFKIGLEVSWYNFMFEKDVRLSTQGTGLELSLDPNGLRKSKLSATYLNVPVLFEVGKRWGMNVGVGGYVGYKVDSWTKATTVSGDKQKDHDGYYLNNFRYGLTGQIGLRWIKLFVNYDLNTLFIKDKAPQINTMSIGFRFL